MGGRASSQGRGREQVWLGTVIRSLDVLHRYGLRLTGAMVLVGVNNDQQTEVTHSCTIKGQRRMDLPDSLPSD